MEDGDNADVIYTDFEKAYEKVEHPKLLEKIEEEKKHFKIKGTPEKWIENSQQVLVYQTKSN